MFYVDLSDNRPFTFRTSFRCCPKFSVVEPINTGYGPAGYALFITVYAGLEASFLTLSSMSLLSLFILTSLSFKALFVFDFWLLDTSHSGSPVDNVGWSSLRLSYRHYHSFYQWNCKLFSHATVSPSNIPMFLIV